MQPNTKQSISSFYYALFFISIILESVGVNFLKLAEGFTILLPTIIAVVCYLSSIALFIFVTAKGEIGVLVALFAGIGTALVAVTGVILYEESISALKVLGVGLIIYGAVAINIGPKQKDQEVSV